MSEEGEELPNANILLNGSKVFTSDIHGDFSIVGLNHGEYTLQFTFVGYDTLTSRVSLHEKDMHLDVRLHNIEIELNEA